MSIAGTRSLAGCTYKLRLYLAPREKAKELDELSSDPATCTMIAQRGVPAGSYTSFGQRKPVGDSTTVQFGTPSTGAGDVGGGAARNAPIGDGGGSWPEAAGYHKAWFEDPLFLDVTDVWSKIDYAYGNGAIQVVLSCSASAAWLSASDWWLAGGPWGGCYVSGDSLFMHAHTEFANQLFCNPTAFTYNSYNENWVTGVSSGALAGWVNATKSGDCASLLSTVHTQLVRTK